MTRATRILVVDDDPSALMTTEAQLRPEGFELVLAPSGAAALQCLDQEPTDLVICDMRMPDIDGLAVCRAIKRHSEWHFVPVILFTALCDTDAIVRGLEAGADEFVTKPVEGPVLRARVRAMLRVRRTYDRLRQEAASTSLDSPDGKRARIIEEAGLTTRERDVLDLLLLGRTHEDIAVVLGISERTSRFHQTNLLAKLGADSRMDLIRLFL